MENLMTEGIAFENSIAARQLQKDFKFLLSRVSHEIRNPLTFVISELQLLTSHHPEITNYEEWDDIVENLEYTKDLLNSLSDYNNADRLSLKNVNLYEFFNTVISGIRPSMAYLNIHFETDISETLPVYAIDPIKLRQALLNLLRNAQDAVSPDSSSRILFRAYEKNAKIHLLVQDNGSGIDPEFLPDLFTPFATTKPAGTGLGLPVTKQIIKAHHGSIEVSSTLGQGTTIQITL